MTTPIRASKVQPDEICKSNGFIGTTKVQPVEMSKTNSGLIRTTKVMPDEMDHIISIAKQAIRDVNNST